jgi:hypothetical protein
MKVTPEEPTVAAATAYFVDMAKGKTTPSRQGGHNGLGAVRHPSNYRVIPIVKLVTPTAQAVARAKDRLSREKIIRGPTQTRKRSTAGRVSSQQRKKKKSDGYSMPGLD